ncbi:MAG: AbrB/MazE/SpoVT family DNA-binding domain-containing protein [Exilibacterium sp.]
METTKLSTKGQVIIPKVVRLHQNWEIGQELMVLETEDGVLLKPRRPFLNTTLDQVAGILKYEGKPKTIEDMDEAIRKGIEKQDDRC